VVSLVTRCVMARSCRDIRRRSCPLQASPVTTTHCSVLFSLVVVPVVYRTRRHGSERHTDIMEVPRLLAYDCRWIDGKTIFVGCTSPTIAQLGQYLEVCISFRDMPEYPPTFAPYLVHLHPLHRAGTSPQLPLRGWRNLPAHAITPAKYSTIKFSNRLIVSYYT
jgi:hypothetical protein